VKNPSHFSAHYHRRWPGWTEEVIRAAKSFLRVNYKPTDATVRAMILDQVLVKVRPEDGIAAVKDEIQQILGPVTAIPQKDRTFPDSAWAALSHVARDALRPGIHGQDGLGAG
jgi:hypothetical protein